MNDHGDVNSRIKELMEQAEELVRRSTDYRAAANLMQEAESLVPSLPEGEQAVWGVMLLAFRQLYVGMSLRADPGSIKEALDAFTQSRDAFEVMAKASPPEVAPQMRAQQLNAEMQIQSIQAAQAPPGEQEAHRTRARELWREIVALSNEPMLTSIDDWQAALKEGTGFAKEAMRAFSEFDLEQATRYIEMAQQPLSRAASVGESLQAQVPALRQHTNYIKGLTQVMIGMAAVIRAVRDGVMGDVTDQHVAALERADESLLEARRRFEDAAQGLPLLQPAELFIPEFLHEIDGRRRQISNLEKLMRQASSPREVTRRAFSRFVLVFLVTFLVVLIGARVSGLVESLGGTEVTTILIISLIAGVIPSFGIEGASKLASQLLPGGRKSD